MTTQIEEEHSILYVEREGGREGRGKKKRTGLPYFPSILLLFLLLQCNLLYTYTNT
jgi:hypothetical protein